MRNTLYLIFGLITAWPGAMPAYAEPYIADQYPGSVLYAPPIEFIPGVWSAIGATAPPSYENSGHNNNLSFVVTGEGVVVINSGASNSLAAALHTEIRRISNQPVVLVINENGQGHAMLGNGYWHRQGVPILAHAAAAEEFAANGHESLRQMQRYNKDKAQGTIVQPPTATLDTEKVYEFGDFRIEVKWLGLAHSAGDIVVWLPRQRLVIAGDMAFHERLLPIFEDTQTAAWLQSWERFAALGAVYVIPGHGHPTNMDQVTRYTRDYLLFLRGAVQQLLDAGGDLQAAYDIDQSAYAHLHTFAELAKKNAGRVFEQMEFE
ncbi:MAG: quinoprotein relay system zinc metallohydrolase 2 [Gammaproteobacteria bacterium]|nr:MAG: quinoprotein relay system zinc metallohydrolase 2 [Gammaproteobacteria bacterium]